MKGQFLRLVAFCFTLVWILGGCTSKTTEQRSELQDVELVTDYGTMIIRLYDETPQHRDNFIKLINDSFYDSVLFHRVIENFMVQAGDPDSRTAAPEDTLGNSDLPYTIPAEFHPDIFHKKGALGAARDGNPVRASSSTQFYIVQGRIYSDSLLDVQEGRINNWLAQNRVVNDSANIDLVKRQNELIEQNEDSDSIQIISDLLDEQTKARLESDDKYVIPDKHRKIYRTAGGAAHLDQNYTVFGEVIQGLEVIDKIAASATNELDRPTKDVRIINARMIERRNNR